MQTASLGIGQLIWLVIIFTSEKLLLVVEAVPLDGGELMFVLLDYLLQSAVQILLLLLKKLLFLDRG